MNKTLKRKGSCIIVFLLAACLLLSCSNKYSDDIDKEVNKEVDNEKDNISNEQPIIKAEVITMTPIPNQEVVEVDQNNVLKKEPTTEIADYEGYFDQIEGCAVFYDVNNESYYIYNEGLSLRQVSPCSTFKIISGLVGLDQEVIASEASTMGYDGTVYKREGWNQDVNLREAFQNSCVWYFRKVIDQIDKDQMQAALDQLNYGNCDISEWEGSKINSSPELNGFWIESSLKISPLEQVKVLTDIFEGRTPYSKEDIEILENIMLTEEMDNGRIYGKTGSGINNNGWFVGFMEQEAGKIYFAVYLEDKNREDISGKIAREIAIRILTEEYN